MQDEGTPLLTAASTLNFDTAPGAALGDAVDAIRQAAKDIGLSFKDVFGKGKGGKVAIKYRDPKNVGNTWTGRGRQPRWLTAALKASKGTKLEDFAVKAA